LNEIIYFKEVRFTSLRKLPVAFGTGKETHTSTESEQVPNVITQQGRKRKFRIIWDSCPTQGEFNNLDIAEAN
jgi:hypothetical protein